MINCQGSLLGPRRNNKKNNLVQAIHLLFILTGITRIIGPQV